MKPRLFLTLLALCALVVNSQTKLQQQQQQQQELQQHHQQQQLQQQSTIEDDDDDEDDEWEEDNYPSKPEIDDEGRIYKNPRNSPSAHCPRDEDQAEIIGQKCLRKCSTDPDCKSKKKKCRCDGYCGMSCIKPDRECAELIEIEHGIMQHSGRLFGDKANYTCDPGYFVVGLASRTCRADGRWSGVTPTCKKDKEENTSYCSAPEKFPNARHNALPEQSSFDLDSVVQYFCNHGYVTKGSPKAKCLMTEKKAGWYGPDIVCEPQSCGTPPDIANGWHAGECYKYDCHVSYHCADSFELVGKAEKVCVADGTWLPAELPKCVEVTSVECEAPESPVNGKAIYTSIAYNSVVSYECKTGFTIVGASTRRCGADAKWTGHSPTCREINCGPPGVLYNGWIDNIENGTGMGASVIFRCKEHMKLEGHSSSLCQMDGQWRYPVPQCLAPCIVPKIARGHVHVHSDERDHINNVTIAEHGKRLVVDCISDYEFAMAHHPVVCNNGTWSIVPSCTPARCKQMPKPPKNGMVIAPKTEHGMKAVFKCKDGFEIIGGGPYNNSFTVECQYGNWTGDIPHCIEVYCPFPGYVQNGKVLLVGNMGVYDYRPYVKKIHNNKQIMYDCDKGYYLASGPPGATCIGGFWSPRELPICELGQHPRIRWNRRKRSTGDDKNETVVVAYRKFVDFFRKLGKKLLELEMEKSHDALGHLDGELIGAIVKNGVNNSSMDGGNHTNHNLTKSHMNHSKSRTKDEKMMDFLRVVYRKLQRIDARHANNETNLTMHELLNTMSKNLFNVDLSETKKSESGPETAETKSQREFTKLKREFERIMKFYNKSLRWSEKHLRKDLKKNKKRDKIHEKEKARSAPKERPKEKETTTKEKKKQQQRNKPPNHYKGFYEFINDYVTQKLTALEAQNATEELIKKMKVERVSGNNQTSFTVGEIYAFFRHIIEAKLNSSRTNDNDTTVSTVAPSTTTTVTASSAKIIDSTTTTATTTTTTTKRQRSTINGSGNPSSSSKKITKSTTEVPSTTTPVASENEIPTMGIIDSNQPKSRSKRVREVSTKSPITEIRRKLLSINNMLSNSGDSIESEKRLESTSSQQTRAKRFLPHVELDNQTFLKNLYLKEYEEDYKARVKRSMLTIRSRNQRLNQE